MSIPQTLREKLATGKVIPFVGAGVSMTVCRKGTNERLFPSWKELLLRVAERLDQEHKTRDATFVRASLDLDNPDFLVIAGQAQKSLGPIWAPFLKGELNHTIEYVQEETLSLPKLIWKLGSRLLITTNYDKVLRWSCPNSGDCETWNIEHKAELAQFLSKQSSEKPTIWHLHGSIEDASRIILTQDGYNRLYSDDDTKRLHDAAINTFRSLLSSHTLLFIGFSFNDEHLGMQLRGIQHIFNGCAGPHYALVKENEVAHLKGLDLPVEPLAFSDFGQPLIDKLKELSTYASEKTSPASSTSSARATVASTATTPPARPRYHPSTPVFHVPFAKKGSQVIGRDEALEKVRQQLSEGRRTAIGHTASFQGLGGLGKTQLAVEYAYQYRDSYPNGVIWLNADQDIDAQLTELAVSAEWIAPESEHKDKLDVAKQRLKSHSNCLIILDNLEDQETIRPYLPSPVVESHILVTSRIDQPGFTPIPLDPLDTVSSLELLYQDACRKPDGLVEESAAREIVTILGGLPLAIELAGAYLCHRKTVPFADYLARLHNDPLKALPVKFLSSFTGHDPDLYRTLKINEELFSEEPLLPKIIDLLTWSGPASMGIELMANLLDTTQVELRGALALGVELRIIQKSPDIDRYAIHRLVREVRKVESPLSERVAWTESMTNKLGDWFQALREDFNNLPQFEAEIDHLIAWSENCCEMPRINARLTWLQAYPPYHRGDYRRAQDIVTVALSMLDDENSTPHELKAHIYIDFGSILRLLGDLNNSLLYSERALAIRKEHLGDDHPDTATSYNSVGVISGALGNYNKALEFERKALVIRRNLFGDNHIDTAESYNNIGITFGKLGQQNKGLEFKQKALSIALAMLGDANPKTATSYNNVGVAFGELGNYKKALEFLQKSYDIRRTLFGENHPDIVHTLNNIGYAYYYLNKNQIAVEALRKAANIGKRILPDTHPLIKDIENRLKIVLSDTKGFRTSPRKQKRR